MSVEVGVLEGIVGCVVAIATFYIGRQSAAKAEGRAAGGLTKDIEYIKTSIDELKRGVNDDVRRLEGRIDEQSRQLADLAANSAKAYESAKMEHNRLNEHLEREHGISVRKE